jgi:basic membrane protein A and related proteins
LKKRLFLVTLMIAALGLASCARSSDCFQKDVFCAALVTDTQGLDDHGMNQDTWAGLKQAKADGVVRRAEYIESIDTRDYEKNITYLVNQGFDAIITVGAGMSDETIRSADLYPDTVFVGLNQAYDESRPNLVPVTFPEDQAGFLAGALAARISDTQIVGAVCETSGIDSMWRSCEGFKAGVAFVNQLKSLNVQAVVAYRDDGSRDKLFVDETWGHDTAQGLIRRGADVIFAAGGLTGQGALRAASEAGIKSIGSERDQRLALAESGSIVVTSVFGDAGIEVEKTLLLLKEGDVQAQSGPVKYVPLDRFFPESLTQELNVWLLSLQSGEVKTQVRTSKP